MPGFLAGITLVGLIQAAPALMNAAAKLVGNVKEAPPSRPTKDLADVRERLNAMESNTEAQAQLTVQLSQHTEAQAALIAQLTQHHAALVRWLLAVTVVLVAVGGTAVAGLVVALW